MLHSYINDPRVEPYDPRGTVSAFAVTDASRIHVVYPDPDIRGLWILSPIPAPREVQRDGAAYAAWHAALPRYLGADAAIAAIIGPPRHKEA